MTVFTLKVPDVSVDCTFAYVEHDANHTYIIPGLNSCMGLIFVSVHTGGHVFLGHDTNPPHLVLKTKFEEYLQKEKLWNMGGTKIIWCAANKNAGQSTWMAKNIPQAKIEFQGISGTKNSIWYGNDPNGKGVVVGSSIKREKSGELTFSFLNATPSKDSNACACCTEKFHWFTKWRWVCAECGSTVCYSCTTVRGKAEIDGKPVGYSPTGRVCVKCNKLTITSNTW